MTRRWTAIGDEWAVLDGARVVATCRDFADALRLCEEKPVAPEAKRPTQDETGPVHARIGDTIRVTRLRSYGREFSYEVASVTPQGFAVNRAFSENSRTEDQYGEHPGDYEIVTKGPLWPVALTPVPPADPVREAEAYKAFRAYVEANYQDGCVLSNVAWHIPRLWGSALGALNAIDALRAARKARGAS